MGRRGQLRGGAYLCLALAWPPMASVSVKCAARRLHTGSSKIFFKCKSLLTLALPQASGEHRGPQIFFSEMSSSSNSLSFHDDISEHFCEILLVSYVGFFFGGTRV
jgi:hypothetical protein